ncbi:MAG: SpaA isopeptide-forming pilin-related protein [Traorella sp.]
MKDFDLDKRINVNKKKKIWHKIVGIMAAFVVFCTTYALILPAITLEKDLNCEKEEHTHTEECYQEEKTLICQEETEDEEGNILHEHTDDCYETKLVLICEKEEHVHTEECMGFRGLPLVEQEEVNALIEMIDSLPSTSEINSTLSLLEKNGNVQNYHQFVAETQEKINKIYDIYDNLKERQKKYVSNIDKALELKEYLLENDINISESLQDDTTIIRELKTTKVEIVDQNNNLIEQDLNITLKNNEKIIYTFTYYIDTFDESTYSEGRAKFEFVLPLTSTQAEFDLESMKWLDKSEGYEPKVVIEDRIFNDQKLNCQVLTGYRRFESGIGESSIIPNEFTNDVVVKVKDMSHGDSSLVQINAAMEYSTWDGLCSTHEIEEKLTIITEPFTIIDESVIELQAENYKNYMNEINQLEEDGIISNSQIDDLLNKIKIDYEKGDLSEEKYLELSNYLLSKSKDNTNVAEQAEGTNWITLRDSGWFEAFSDYSSSSSISQKNLQKAVMKTMSLSKNTLEETTMPSDVQVVDRGGTVTSDDGAVTVSKIISGTDIENVFDITLQVQTAQNIYDISKEPDMAVVIVMDISNTMNANFGGVTRYAAAMEAAEQFLDQFVENNSLGISKVGYVAFNTDAHQIFELQSCSTEDQARTLKNTMREETGKIINQTDYSSLHSRFTNIEAGLAMANDMLNGVSNENKFIIFLSDGFPTTYISSGYNGYDPYDTTGRFYDHVLNKPCSLGTSYSDEAAIRARNKANEIKASGTTIFSIGVDVQGQTIQKYITQSENADGFSVVDRTSTSYEIGDASSTEAYKNWLRNSIGSGYYYDSTDSSGLALAYNQIFESIHSLIEQKTEADWVANDPMPTISGSLEPVEFIGFYTKTPELTDENLTGEYVINGENTASFNNENETIVWDLKQSGYTISTNGSTTTYTYQLVYRVHLKNENSDFIEEKVYPTNNTTTLQYRTIENIDGIFNVSQPKTIEFPIPSVIGYLVDFSFDKVDSLGRPLKGAQFILKHDIDNCSICKGNNTAVELVDMTAISDENGVVEFKNVPSGHKYILEEISTPEGYIKTQDTYQIIVAYDNIDVIVKSYDGTTKQWENKIINYLKYELPETGGKGSLNLKIVGILFMFISLLTYGILTKKKR